MPIKVVLLLACVALAQANWIPPVAHGSLEYSHVPEYSYSYGVNDPHTGDSKNQQETRHGDLVQGQYSLIESDGTRRTVDYASDAVNGFNAVVRRHGLSLHSAPVAAPAVNVVHAAPIGLAAPALSVAVPAVSSYSSSAQTVAHPSTLAVVSPALGYSAGVSSLGWGHGANLVHGY